MAKTKEGCLLGQGEKARSDDSALSSKQKTESFHCFWREKKTAHGNDSKDTRKIMSAVINQSGKKQYLKRSTSSNRTRHQNKCCVKIKEDKNRFFLFFLARTQNLMLSRKREERKEGKLNQLLRPGRGGSCCSLAQWLRNKTTFIEIFCLI